jgi:putative intracellular protease/amidase
MTGPTLSSRLSKRPVLGVLFASLALAAAPAASHAAPATIAAPAPSPSVKPGPKTVGVVLYPGFEVLDVFGPIEMWANVPDLKVVLIAEHAGPVKSAQGVSVNANFGFAEAPPLDIMMVPGGLGTFTELKNPAFLTYLKSEDRRTQLTTSVCTGSALLAKAGLLTGRRATSNKKFFSLAVGQDAGVTWVKHARWVEDGKYFTSSGVSAGTDMALGVLAKLYGKDQARKLARTLEYQWSEDPANDPFAIE